MPSTVSSKTKKNTDPASALPERLSFSPRRKGKLKRIKELTPGSLANEELSQDLNSGLPGPQTQPHPPAQGLCKAGPRTLKPKNHPLGSKAGRPQLQHCPRGQLSPWTRRGRGRKSGSGSCRRGGGAARGRVFSCAGPGPGKTGEGLRCEAGAQEARLLF